MNHCISTTPTQRSAPRLRTLGVAMALCMSALSAHSVQAKDVFEIIFNDFNRPVPQQAAPAQAQQPQIQPSNYLDITPAPNTQVLASIGGRVRLAVVDRITQSPLAIYLHKGEYWVAGSPNQAYALNLISQDRARRALAVTSVDGINVVSGELAGFSQRGYVLSPFTPAGINGWRKSEYEIAAFNFGAPQTSYASQTGRPANLGVIGVAVFPEFIPAPQPPVVIGHPRVHAEMRPGTAPNAGLGTQHGQREESHAASTTFNRESNTPAEVIVLRYDTIDNLIARGILQVQRPVFPQNPVPNPFPAPNNGFVVDPPAYRR